MAFTILCFGGCASVPEIDTMLKETPQGAVYLERIPDLKFQAAHPVKLEHEVIARTLRGIYVREEQSTLQTLISGSLGVNRVFSEDDVAFLTPLIVTGLTQAVSDQRIGFRTVHPAPLIVRSNQGGAGIGSSDPISGAGTETTEGNLYAYGTSLHVTLTKYRFRPEPAETINMQNRRIPDNSGLRFSEVFFYPTEARRPESYQPSKLLGEPLLTTLVIDYQLLAKLPASMLTPPQPKKPEGAQTTAGQPAAPGTASSGATAPSADKGEQTLKEMESLKEEMKRLREQMEQQQEEMKRMKGQSKLKGTGDK